MLHWHHLFLQPCARNISPVPTGTGLDEFACTADSTLCAWIFGSGARQGGADVVSEDPFSSPLVWDASARGRLDCWPSSLESGRGRFSPTTGASELPAATPISTVSLWSVGRPIIFHGSSGVSRTTINTPGVPAYRRRVSIFSTHVLHTKAS